jgi:hypothetical protein
MDPLTIRLIQMDLVIWITLHPRWWFRYSAPTDCPFHTGSAWTLTQTNSDGAELWLTQLLGLTESHSLPGVFSYSIHAGVLLPQLPVVVKLLAIPTEEIPARVKLTEDFSITNTEYTNNTNINIVLNAFEASIMQMSNVNEHRYTGYNTDNAHPIQSDLPPPNAPTGSTH